jgi:hypothetical protein
MDLRQTQKTTQLLATLFADDNFHVLDISAPGTAR